MSEKVEQELSLEEMNELTHGQSQSERHKSVVFDTKQSADKRDMTKSIGRFSPHRKAISFIDDNGVGTKYMALYRNGFSINVSKNGDGNYFVDLSPAHDMMEKLNEAKQRRQQTDTSEPDFEPSLIEQDEFLKNHNDGAIDIMITTPKLQHDHRVGLLNLSTGHYTLRPELINELDDFEYELDEDSESPVANIATDSIKATKLVKLLSLLKKEDKDDEEIDEANETQMNVPALSSVKRMIHAMAIARRHGDIEGFDEMKTELEQELDELEQGNSIGIDEVRAQIADIENAENENELDEAIKPSEREVIESLVDAGRIHTQLSDDELIKKALNYGH
ncbi:hypothetical protein TUM4644_33310 [Shewanella colwelliana]|uniref:hypothetical protein n=1 Tax=Shewanella colwelliana TaxID=23 RepID=UPI001BBDF0D6|nr:hypothetical protein [Shewanella colwelliana]GIU32905.1 hypothetical protein TUM4644_33310 [Shewanella colwelliana]